MRRRMLASAVLLIACSGELQPGPMGKPLDMREYLPDSLRSQAAVKPDTTFRAQIVVGPDSAQVEIEWAAFRLTSGRYLASVSARSLAPAKLDSLRLGAVSDLINVGSKTAPVESAKIEVRWFKHSLLRHRAGATIFGFDALGRRIIAPAGR